MRGINDPEGGAYPVGAPILCAPYRGGYINGSPVCVGPEALRIVGLPFQGIIFPVVVSTGACPRVMIFAPVGGNQWGQSMGTRRRENAGE